MTPEIEILDVDGAAVFLKAKVSTIRTKAHRGEIPGRKVGKGWIFVKAHLAEWVSGRYDPTPVKLAEPEPEEVVIPDTIPPRLRKERPDSHVKSEYQLLLGSKGKRW